MLTRDVRLGCRGYPHLVADGLGGCDLEATLLVLELCGSLPAAARLAQPMLSASPGR